ncbi:energy-coupling factor transporter transmembrane protein EcfT [Rhizobiales bacterium]|uniref:energy-coupling factor transporter transmembrane component T family protein n=1 Tax=Hongsoonwoonella zoysiae TaxID=2821844 RepID=UPI00156140E0|nr:energy-coupling factor transporter transmembrane protein EcfT [Hongsoonwoonella zoysiae]NRG17197.1 energy-coupling factor transporter transmembrane protein EcfT [Hongsoonwoonella zoysiae]
MISTYISGDSWLHRLPAGWKLIGLCIFTMVLFPVESPAIAASGFLAALALFTVVGREGYRRLLALRSVLYLLVFLLIFHVLAGTLTSGIVAVFRLMTMVVLATLVTFTTRMEDMLDALNPVLTPLNFIGISSRRIALAIALVIRFTPFLIALADELGSAFKARTGKRGGVRLTAPFAVLALRTADHVSDALAARGGADGFDNIDEVGEGNTPNDQ